METSYILNISGRYVVVTPIRWVYWDGLCLPVEGEDVFGNTWPINEFTSRACSEYPLVG